MQEYRPASIRVVAILMMILSFIIIVVTGIFLLIYLDYGSRHGGADFAVHDTGHYFWDRLIHFILLIFGMGVVSLVACIGLLNYRMWGNVLLSLMTLGYLVLLWWWMWENPRHWFAGPDIADFFAWLFFLLAFAVSIPFVILLRFLNLSKIKSHFY